MFILQNNLYLMSSSILQHSSLFYRVYKRAKFNHINKLFPVP